MATEHRARKLGIEPGFAGEDMRRREITYLKPSTVKRRQRVEVSDWRSGCFAMGGSAGDAGLPMRS